MVNYKKDKGLCPDMNAKINYSVVEPHSHVQGEANPTEGNSQFG